MFPLLLAGSLAVFSSALAQEHEHTAGQAQELGQVEFPTSCIAEVQTDFNRAVAMLHSFWYTRSEKEFAEVAQRDPHCAMGYWGIAMSRFHQLWEKPSPEDIAAGQRALEAARTPSGAACEDPALRPDNAPVCPVLDSGGRLSFVTLRGGGLVVVDPTATPIAILAEYDRTVVHANGCGGSEAAGKVYLRAGGGTPANPTHSDLYAFPLSRFTDGPHAINTPAPRVVFSYDDRGFVDAHGGVLTKAGRYLWVGDRFGNRIVVVDVASDSVVNEIGLSGGASSDPAPDIMDIAPGADWVFISLRGPRPLSMNVPEVGNAVGSSPGVGVVRVEEDGRRGELVGLAPITHQVGGEERADPHGLKVRWP